MSNINLLAQEKKPDPNIYRLSKKLKKISIFGYTIFFIVVGALGGGFYYFNQELNSSVIQRDDVKTQISALKQTEQRLLIIRDRLTKIKGIQSAETASEEINLYSYLWENSSNVNIESGILTNKDISVSVVLENSTVMSQLIDTLVNSEKYTNVRIDSLRYAAESGYKLQFTIIGNTENL